MICSLKIILVERAATSKVRHVCLVGKSMEENLLSVDLIIEIEQEPDLIIEIEQVKLFMVSGVP